MKEMKNFLDDVEMMNEVGREAHSSFEEVVEQFLAMFPDDTKLRQLQFVMCHAMDCVIMKKITIREYGNIFDD